MSTLSERRVERGLLAVLACVAAFTAFWAFAGALGLASGAADLGAEVTARLPMRSPGFAAAMLVIVVALPMTVAAVSAVRADRRAPLVCGGSGAALMAWVAIQPAVIGTVYWLQPVVGLLGAVLCVTAFALWRHRHRSADRPV
ncbi:hypothetical protein ACTD5D_17485 [Nocardia takedensis]|uniref:hypothetical protein n=1 Tax=Nocardia takedensis TaxID=259390 RepID=UPI0003050261|nr:hypothetical protein [Nocardia takedensis]